jgi:hypothetical protein
MQREDLPVPPLIEEKQMDFMETSRVGSVVNYK